MTSNNPFKKYLIVFWSVFAAGVLAIVILFTLISDGKLGYMPTLTELENIESSLASEVYTADSLVMRRYYYKENRTFTSFDAISPNVIHALIATEDERFYSHPGIDLRGLFRVFKGIATGDQSAGGGSTLSQQLAKMLFPREDITNKFQLAVRKLREWVIAVKLERSFTKEEIISMYLNKYDFLNLAVGIKSASQIYFGTTPDKLTLEQAAMLVGMAKNSSLYNPVRRPQLVLARRNVVLSQMNKNGYLTDAEFNHYKTLPLNLSFHKEDYKSTPGTYFTEYLRTLLNAPRPERENYKAWQLLQFHEDSIEWDNNPLYGWCTKNPKPDGKLYDIYTDGLKIYSTIDMRMQMYAEKAVITHLSKNVQPLFNERIKGQRNRPFSNDLTNEQAQQVYDNMMKGSDRYRSMRSQGINANEIKRAFLTRTEMTVFSWRGEIDTVMSPLDSIKYHLGFLRSAMMTMEVKTGKIKAWVGGPNYKHFMYDMVKSGRRQVGSTVKPFLYTLAMQNGFSPCTLVPNTEHSFTLFDGSTWTAKNSGETKMDGKMVTLKWGLANSVNQISAWVMKQFNPQAMADMMHKLGITSPIDAVPSMFLGTSDVSVYEMVGAYGTYGNHGVYTKPYCVTRIEDRNGNVLARFSPESHDAIDAKTAYLMINLMEAVVNEGTSARLRRDVSYGNIKADVAGKTGTTQNQSDGWFMGITPELVTGVWTGGDLRSIHFEGLSAGQGASMALPVYGYYMNSLFRDRSLGYTQSTVFEVPPGFNVDMDCRKVMVEEKEDESAEKQFF
ncbi:MAG: transglycosylase domain-containing protein [Prolixibacteraceae bacterium]|jgi:penicillin-binding protein 1A|nr:transglycosylase domain-containing protein [Prolixibacteraceae bacterium]